MFHITKKGESNESMDSSASGHAGVSPGRDRTLLMKFEQADRL